MNGTRAVKKSGIWGRFEKDEQGRWIVRLKTLQLVLSVVISVATVFSILLGAVAAFARPYLEDISRSVVAVEAAKITGELDQLSKKVDRFPQYYITREEQNRAILEINTKLDTIAGNVNRLGDRVEAGLQNQSARTDSLYSNLMRALRNQ